MKKNIIIISLLSLVSCVKNIEVTGEKLQCGDIDFMVMKIGKCEYLLSKNSVDNGRLFAHKGDCSNPKHNPIIKIVNMPFDSKLLKDTVE
jgi:hypothetical protein